MKSRKTIENSEKIKIEKKVKIEKSKYNFLLKNSMNGLIESVFIDPQIQKNVFYFIQFYRILFVF